MDDGVFDVLKKFEHFTWRTENVSLKYMPLLKWSCDDSINKTSTRFSGPKSSTHPDLLTSAALEVFVQLCLRQEKNASRMCSCFIKNVHLSELRIFFRCVFNHRIVILSSQGACWSSHLNLAADLQTAARRTIVGGLSGEEYQHQTWTKIVIQNSEQEKLSSQLLTYHEIHLPQDVGSPWFFFVLRIFESPSLLNQHKHPSTKSFSSFSSYPQISGEHPDPTTTFHAKLIDSNFFRFVCQIPRLFLVFQTWKSHFFWTWTGLWCFVLLQNGKKGVQV